MEGEFGIEPEEGGKLKRRTPRTLAQAAERLAQESGVAGGCPERLREVLDHGGALIREDGGRAFAFKLHQFIGQGRALFATLEAANQREFSLEGQVQASGGRLFASIKFCRQCGQDYYHVLQSDSHFLPHPVGMDNESDEGNPGYLMLAPAENDWSEERLPHGGVIGDRGERDLEQRSTGLQVTPTAASTLLTRRKDGWRGSVFVVLNCGEFYTHVNGSSKTGLTLQ